MHEMFDKIIGVKLDVQALASFFQNDFEGEYPEFVIEDFEESMDNFIENMVKLKAEAMEFLINKK